MTKGTVVKQGNRIIIRLYSINLDGLNQARDMLLEFDINGKIVKGFGAKRNVYALTINDIKSFKTIGFGLNRKRIKLDSFSFL